MDSEKPFSAIVGIGPFTIQARTGPEGEPSGWVGFPGWGFLLSSFRIRLIMRADGCRLGMMALQSRVRNLMALVPAVLLMASCNFQPDIKPLIFATAPPQPFSAFAPTEGDLSQIPSQSAPAETLGVVEKEADLAGFPAALAWAAGVLAAAAATISGFTFLIQRQESRPPVVLLIILAIIFLILFGILMEGLFAAAEAVLALSAATAATALLSLTVAAITAFLVNFEVAFCVYVIGWRSLPHRRKSNSI